MTMQGQGQTVQNRMILRALAEGKIQWVRRTKDGKPGYFRRTPDTYEKPTPAQSELRLRFSEVSYNLFGVCGTVKTFDGREISIDADRLGQEMHGQKFSKDKQPSNIEKILLLLP